MCTSRSSPVETDPPPMDQNYRHIEPAASTVNLVSTQTGHRHTGLRALWLQLLVATATTTTTMYIVTTPCRVTSGCNYYDNMWKTKLIYRHRPVHNKHHSEGLESVIMTNKVRKVRSWQTKWGKSFNQFQQLCRTAYTRQGTNFFIKGRERRM